MLGLERKDCRRAARRDQLAHPWRVNPPSRIVSAYVMDAGTCKLHELIYAPAAFDDCWDNRHTRFRAFYIAAPSAQTVYCCYTNYFSRFRLRYIRCCDASGFGQELHG